MTAREVAKRYCSHWIWAGYCGAWSRKNPPNLPVTEDERENARRSVSNELKAMLRLAFERGEEEEPSAPNPTESQEVKTIRRGRLPKKKGETGQVPIIAGLLDGEVSRLRVDVQGAWTLEPREDAFAGKPVGGKAKNVTERFVVTRDDGATCHLTITLKITEKRMRTNGGSVKPTKRAVYVSEKSSSWTHKRNPSQRREKLDNFARARAFGRTVDEVEHFAGPAPVPLRVQGKLGINQPLVPLAFDDIRNIEFDIEANEAFGDGRKFEGLRFFIAAERLPVDEHKPTGGEEGHSGSHSSKAVLRNRLKLWLEQRAKPDSVLTKKQCLEEAQLEFETSITMNMLNEVWREAKLPKTWRERGRRPGA